MPETVTGTWREQVLDEHRELRATIVFLREFLQEPRPDIGRSGSHSWAAELAKQLASLHDELFRHFRHEEEGGMVEEISLEHPRASARIETIVDQHPAMLRELRHLTNMALTYSEGRSPSDPALRQRVKALLDGLDKHEREETDLIQRLALRDSGVGD